MAEILRLMAVHAHPDDESSKGAATLAKYAATGHDVMVVTLTGGERGSVLNPAMDHPIVAADIAGHRRREMAAAAGILGVRHRWLGYVDSGLPESDTSPLPAGCFARVPLETSAGRLVEVVREFRPHVLVTYDAHGDYPHPDHIRCHEVSVRAFDAAGDPELYPGAGRPWTPLKLYYLHGFSHARVRAIREAMRTPGREAACRDWLAELDAQVASRGLAPDALDRVTTRIECGEYLHLRDAALRAHATQIEPDGHWFTVPLDLRTAVWPFEEYELARGLVDTEVPEDDLFAGVRRAVNA